MKKNLLLPLLLLLFLLPQSHFAQIERSTAFEQQLQQAQLDFFEPSENSFKQLPIRKNTVQTYDFAIQSKREKVEIRYVILPAQDQVLDDFPPVNFTAKASSVASNEEEEFMVFHAMDEATLKNTFNADWGASAFFRPKIGFSNKRHCKMVGLYSKGKANIYIFYLFNDLSIDIDERFHLVRFLETEQTTN
ncbi:MAG: hypothetical protein AAGD05_03665 [Bacteroidota bacterium]